MEINFSVKTNIPNIPQRLDSALNYIAKTEKIPDVFIKGVSKNEELASTTVTKLIAEGSRALVFETSNGDILKLSDGNHFPLNRPQESFDVPIFKKGKVGNMYYYLEEKLSQRNMSEGFVDTVIEWIKEKGYRPYDIKNDINQIGLSKSGKLYLLDPECAKYKTIFHALYDKTKNSIKLFLRK